MSVKRYKITPEMVDAAIDKMIEIMNEKDGVNVSKPDLHPMDYVDLREVLQAAADAAPK